MIPVLLNLRFLKVPTFGVFLVLAFFWGMFMVWRNIKLTSYKEEDIFDGLFSSIVGVLFFSRLFYVILNFSDFGFDFMRFILINGYPGMSLYGALFGGFLSFSLFCKSQKIDFMHLVDYLTSSVMMALAIGKIGSFFAGIDVGVKTKFIIATKYLGYEGLRHVTALYEAIIFGLGVYFLYKILMQIRKSALQSGFSFYFFIFYFAAVNLLLDNLKENRLYFFGVSFNFAISALLAIVFGVYFIFYFRKDIFNYGNQTFQKLSKRTKRETA
jgi:phosphatidylglycerol:prolipoprotein diacylglycerol transferase